jgi:hypothetical protein
MFPGTTAQDFARQAAIQFPTYSGELESTASSFDAVRYLDEPGTEGQWRQVEWLARELASAKPSDQLQNA